MWVCHMHEISQAENEFHSNTTIKSYQVKADGMTLNQKFHHCRYAFEVHTHLRCFLVDTWALLLCNLILEKDFIVLTFRNV